VDAIGSHARFERIGGLAADVAGNVYVADGYFHFQTNPRVDRVFGNTVRRIAPTGHVATIAGTPGTYGFVDGLGAEARFSSPGAMVIDGSRNVLVADRDNRAIRKVTPSGEVTTVLRGIDAQALAVDPAGHLLLADWKSIRRLRTDGTLEIVAGAPSAWLGGLEDLAVDGAGSVHGVDRGKRTVVTMDPTGNVVRVIGATEGPAVALDGPVSAARFASPRAVAARADGVLFIVDGHSIRKVEAGVVTTLAGVYDRCGAVDGQGTDATFCEPRRLVLAADGSLYVADARLYSSHLVRRVTPDGALTTLAGASGQFGFVDGKGAAARFSGIRDLTLGSDGNVYLLDNDSLRRLEPDGTITTIRGTSGMLKGQSLTALPGGRFIVAEYLELKLVTVAGEILPVAGNQARAGSCRDGVGPGAWFESTTTVEAAADGTLFVGGWPITRGTPLPLVAPTITSISPSRVGAGAGRGLPLAVFGTNFSEAGLKVTIGGVDANNVDVVSDTVMIVSVPSSSTVTTSELSVATAAGTAATTATVEYVGNESLTATAEMKPRKTLPPTALARCTAAMLPPPSRPPLASRNCGLVSTKVIAPKPMMNVST
jgi:hypothetical protein